DEKDATVAVHQEAVISRSLAMARLRSSTSIPICSPVFDFPRPKRMAPNASGSETPIAVSTGDGLRSPELHADPAESEKRRMAMITDSASTRSKLTFRLPGNLS